MSDEDGWATLCGSTLTFQVPFALLYHADTVQSEIEMWINNFVIYGQLKI